MASAFPFTAVSKTMSSFASDSFGRQRNASLTCLATEARSSRTRPTSPAVNPHAARCSGRVRTASYSSMRGTESSNSKRWSKTPSRSCLEAPRLLRKAATSTSVSSTYANRTPDHDIACNITSQGRIVLAYKELFFGCSKSGAGNSFSNASSSTMRNGFCRM